jgi:hypothetical protein
MSININNKYLYVSILINLLFKWINLYNIIIINIINTRKNSFQPYGYDYKCNYSVDIMEWSCTCNYNLWLLHVWMEK